MKKNRKGDEEIDMMQELHIAEFGLNKDFRLRE